MPSKKKPSKKSVETVAHYNAILIEELHSEMKFVIEKVSDMEERINQRIDEKFAKLEMRLDVIEGVVKSHSATLQSHSQILEKHSQILEAHGKTLERIENILEKVVEKLEQHDHDIKQLKAFVSLPPNPAHQ